MSDSFAFAALPPLTLYIHIPWCQRKCPYCDFNSHENTTQISEQAYVDALIADLEQDLPSVWGRRISSIFIGGGTPSLFSPESFDKLLCAVRARLAVSPEAEITLEANPGSSEAQKFRDFRALGINRLSIGVQSFNDDMLHALGRIHGRREAIRAAEAAHAAGFDNFNLDLMFALPQQKIGQALDDVNTAIALEPTHISYYQLTLEPNTLFHKQPPALPTDDDAWQMQELGQELLAVRGFQQYEVSAYAQPGRQCLHNVNYWQFGDYLGIGAGAHAKISDAGQQNITRACKSRQPRDYVNGLMGDPCDPSRFETKRSIGGASLLSPQDAVWEFMINALRLTEGFPCGLFTDHTGLPVSVLERPLMLAQERGLLVCNGQTIQPTTLGKQFLNDLVQIFMPEAM